MEPPPAIVKPMTGGQSEPTHSVHNTHNCSSVFLSETYFSQLPSNGLSCYHFLRKKGGADNLLIFYLSIPRTGEGWKALEVLAYSQNLSSYPSTPLPIHPPIHLSAHPPTMSPFCPPPTHLSLLLSPTLQSIHLPFAHTFTIPSSQPSF